MNGKACGLELVIQTALADPLAPLVQTAVPVAGLAGEAEPSVSLRQAHVPDAGTAGAWSAEPLAELTQVHVPVAGLRQ